jgi:DNA-binding NarL/FixJ family response regulator
METINILIAEDHLLLRETWTYILNIDKRFNVIAAAASGEQAVEMACALKPDIILMDINLPGISGLDATELIVKGAPNSKILGVSFHNAPGYAIKMIQKGAMGYISKNSTSEELFEAILEVNSGNKYICREVKDILSNQAFNPETAENVFDKLSPREREIAELLKGGNSSKEISHRLQISTKTVEVHRYNILRKLNIKNAAALVNLLHKWSFN